MKDRPRRTLKLKSPPVLLVITKPKKPQTTNKNRKKQENLKRIKAHIQTPPRKQKAEETQESGGSEKVVEAVRGIDLGPISRGEWKKQVRPSGAQRRRLQRQEQRRVRLWTMGKRRDQASNTMLNSILEYFS